MEYYLITTDKCNLACDYCFARQPEYPGRNSSRAKPTYSVEDLIKSFRRNKKIKEKEYSSCNACRTLTDKIVFYGGEPLLNQPFIKKVIEAIKADDELNHFKFAIQTNGTLLKTTQPYILKNLDHILVSIDGTKEAHDKHRRFPDGTGHMISSWITWIGWQCKRLLATLGEVWLPG